MDVVPLEHRRCLQGLRLQGKTSQFIFQLTPIAASDQPTQRKEGSRRSQWIRWIRMMKFKWWNRYTQVDTHESDTKSVRLSNVETKYEDETNLKAALLRSQGDCRLTVAHLFG